MLKAVLQPAVRADVVRHVDTSPAYVFSVQVSSNSMEIVELVVCKLVLKSSGLNMLASKRGFLHEYWTSMLEIGKVERSHQIEFSLDTMVTRVA